LSFATGRTLMEEVPWFLRKRLVAVALLFFASMFSSCTEFRYAISSKRTQARVIEVSRSTLSTPGSTRWRVKYHFQDEGKPRIEEVRVPDSPEFAMAAKDVLPIEYIPRSPGYSRIAGQRDYFSLVFFFGTLLLMIGSGVYLHWRQRRERAPLDSAQAKRTPSKRARIR
jgi:hypothetical protein